MRSSLIRHQLIEALWEELSHEFPCLNSWDYYINLPRELVHRDYLLMEEVYNHNAIESIAERYTHRATFFLLILAIEGEL